LVTVKIFLIVLVVSLSELQHAKVFFLSLLSTLLGTPNEIKERKKVKKKVKKHLGGISKL